MAWNNSTAMFRHLKELTKSAWEEEDLPRISLANGASTMHKLQYSLSHLGIVAVQQQRPLVSSLSCNVFQRSGPMDWISRQQAEALEDELVVLLEVLTTRRLRMGGQ